MIVRRQIIITEIIETQPEYSPDYPCFGDYVHDPNEPQLVREKFWDMIKRKLTQGINI